MFEEGGCSLIDREHLDESSRKLGGETGRRKEQTGTGE